MSLSAVADQAVSLPSDPDVSPDGKQIVFSWHGDLWLAPLRGGVIRPLTTSDHRDELPRFSPNGKEVAFIRNVDGSRQVFLVAVRGGTPRQITFHSEGCRLEQWAPDGKSLLISAQRDHFWRHADRFFLIDADPHPFERLLFDAYGRAGRLSPDGTRLLFTREGVAWWRKGYRGSQASQIWEYDLERKKFREVCRHPTGCRSPLWLPNGRGMLYVTAKSGSFNLWHRDLESGKDRQLTHFDDDSVVMPTVSRDGKVVVFRKGFQFYRLALSGSNDPEVIPLKYRGDQLVDTIHREELTDASEVAFTKDGLEIAFVAGGDIWVMDTVLREPRQVTDTEWPERDPVFSPDGNALFFVRDTATGSDIWRVERKNSEKYWWQNIEFQQQQLTENDRTEQDLRFSPDGEQLAFVRGLGDLWLMKSDGTNERRLISSWNVPRYDWSPDGKWIVYAQSDNNFNRDVFLLPVDRSRPPFNLSRHPDNDDRPVWSPDGRMIAFTGRRVGEETDIYFVYLRKEDDEQSSRDRKLAEAIEKLKKARPPAAKEKAAEEDDKEKPKPEDEKKRVDVVIDFEELADRVRRVSIPDTSETTLFWSPDSKKLAFVATINGTSGLYTISPPDQLTPQLLVRATGSSARWLAKGNQIVWLSEGKPTRVGADGKTTTYSFTALHEYDREARNEVIFDLCWRTMRDKYYDENLNHRDWNEVRGKYAPEARRAVDDQTLVTVVQMMLGELNGSHLGFSLRSSRESENEWREQTAHLGVRFDLAFEGPGWKIANVIPKGPAAQKSHQLEPGEVILKVDGKEVFPNQDVSTVLNGPPARDVRLEVQAADGKTRTVVLRPISYGRARSLLYEKWIRDNQALVEKVSKGRLGYVHIQGMNMTSFYRFERELFAVASGKDGLVIDVRENGGGHTTDRLLTILTQPEHAITVPRGGGPGYPQDRRVYATWSKPIVVLCNQNSFSNAEIFSHAIKTLKRGTLVGVPTSGSVISTGSARILDVGYLRLPFRGWFLIGDGQDMELNGAVPDRTIWPRPGEWPSGVDRQLITAIRSLDKAVSAWQRKARPKLIKASDRTASDTSRDAGS